MDFGPFSWIEAYNPHYCSWCEPNEEFTYMTLFCRDGDPMRNFGFLNQTEAGFRNIQSLFHALSPLIKDTDAQWAAVKAHYWNVANAAKKNAFRQKLGLNKWDDETEHLLTRLLELMQSSRADWTITFRQLAALLDTSSDPLEQLNLLKLEALTDENEAKWKSWIREWLSHIDASEISRTDCAALIRKSSPKYVPREWMLIDAYTAAEQDDFEPALELFALLAKPYAEQPEFEAKYYQKKPVYPMG